MDIPSIQNVINYELARDIDTHTHRIGRTGRAGTKGTAFTLFVRNRDPAEFGACLVKHLESVNQHVPPALMDIAMKCSWFQNERSDPNANGPNPTQSRPSFAIEPRSRSGLGLMSDHSSKVPDNEASEDCSDTLQSPSKFVMLLLCFFCLQ